MDENTVVNTEVERAYTLRPMKEKDLWPVLDIVAKVFPGEELSTAFANVVENKSLEEVGAAVALKLFTAVITNMPLIRAELYAFLSDVCGKTVEEIEDMEFGTSPLMVYDIFNDVKNASFFRVLSKSF